MFDKFASTNSMIFSHLVRNDYITDIFRGLHLF